MRADCTIYYPGSDGISRSTPGTFTIDHAASSYGQPVLVIEQAETWKPADPLMDAVIGVPGIHLIAGSKAERLSGGVYGPADLPPAAAIVVHYRLIDDGQTYDDIERIAAAAKRAGYPIVEQ